MIATSEKVPMRHEHSSASSAVKTPIQTSLDLREQINRPLVKVDMVAAFLRRSEDNIIQTLIPNGLLPWAFDIARNPDGKRREIRVLAESVDAYNDGTIYKTHGPGIAHEQGAREFQRVISVIIPRRTEIRSFELAHWFFCDKSHISHLIKDGSLKTTRPAVGCKSAIIDRASIVEFLKSRRITS